MANNPNERESYHEIPAKKYIFIFDTAIHKRFFFWASVTIWLATYLLTRLVNLDMMIIAWHLQNWWIFATYTGIGLVAALVWKHEVERTAKKQEQEYRKLVKYQKNYIDKKLPEPDLKGEVNFQDESNP